VPKGVDWLHEPKLGGYRFQVVKDGRQVRLYSRGGTEWTKRLPAFADTFRRLPCRSTILDGELVLPDADGAPDFGGLHAAVRSAAEVELNFFAFDLLHCDGTDLLRFPLIERKLRLARLVGRGGIRCMHLVQIFDDGVKLLEAAERMQLGGIVSKRRMAPYRSGECRDWRKVKIAAWREANQERSRMFERA
jgi:bifunctional non-homologous end joining protein LigD